MREDHPKMNAAYHILCFRCGYLAAGGQRSQLVLSRLETDGVRFVRLPHMSFVQYLRCDLLGGDVVQRRLGASMLVDPLTIR